MRAQKTVASAPFPARLCRHFLLRVRKKKKSAKKFEGVKEVRSEKKEVVMKMESML